MPETILKEFVFIATLDRAADQVFFDPRRNVLQQITQEATDQMAPHLCKRLLGDPVVSPCKAC